MPTEIIHGVRPYGVFVAAAHLLGFGFLLWLSRNSPEKRKNYLNLCLLVTLTGLLGAKALYSAEHGWMQLLSLSGFSAFGGLLFALPSALLYLNRSKLSAATVADEVAPVLPLCLAIIRLGCLQAGCCHGSAIDTHTNQLHPTQMYEAIFLVLLSALSFLFSFREAGDKAKLILLSYAVYRACFDSLRGDLVPVFGPWTITQLSALTMVILLTIPSKYLFVIKDAHTADAHRTPT